MKRHLLSIRFVVFTLVLVAGLLSAMAVFLQERQQTMRATEDELGRYAITRGGSISGMVEYLLRRGNTEAADRVVSDLGQDLALVWAVICDADNQILFSTRYEFRGRPLREIGDDEQLRLVQRVRSRRAGLSEVHSSKRLICASFPFLLNSVAGEIRPSQQGVLILVYDLSVSEAQAKTEMLVRCGVMAAILFGQGVLVWGVLYLLVTRRIRRLDRAVASMAGEGNYLASNVRGPDEIGALGKTFDRMTEDVLEQRQALERARRELEERVQQRTAELTRANQRLMFHEWAIRSAIHPMAFADLDGIVTFVNPAFARAWGYDREDEIVGQSVAVFWANPDEAAQYVQQVLREGQVSGEGKGRRKDGSFFDAEISTSLVRDEQGNPIRIFGSFTDVTEHRRAEAMIRKSQERFRLLADTVRDMFWIADVAIREIQYVSPGYEQIWGRSVQSLYDDPRSMLEAIHPDDREQVRAGLEVQKTGHPFEHEYRVVRPDGSIRWVWDRGYPFWDKKGQVGGYVGIAEDISERKLLEAQLRQAQKMEALGQLAGGVAHDFNNLLMVLLSNTQFAKDAIPAASAAATDLQTVLDAGQRATTLVRQLLIFSRRHALEPRLTDLNQLIAGVGKMLRRVIGEDITIVLRPSEQLHKVMADPAQIEQVIMNLAVNARDAMPSGGRLTIETADALLDDHCATQMTASRGIAAGTYAMFAVADAGVGMTEEVRTHIFEPFFTTKEVGKGTGLGLSTVFGIVKQHGGHISVYSECGKGTVFKVYLPAVQEAATGDEPRETEMHMPRGGETVLVVEDDDHVRHIAERILKKQGYRVLQAATGEEGLRIIREFEGRIDLLLTDLVMPGIDGASLAGEVQCVRPRVKVIFMSGYTSEKYSQYGIAEDKHSLLIKPVSREDLAHKVRAVLDSG